MVNIAIGGQLSRKFKLPNIELYYGPYSSALAAHNTLSLASIGLNIIGYTVGIAVNPVFDPDNPNKMLSYDYILEYWYKGGTSLQNLVPKQEAQVLSNWNQENSQSLDYIKNKPTNVSAFANDAGYLTQHQSLDNYYTKTQVNSSLSGKANTSDVNDSLNLKADKSDTYTKTQVDTALSAKANSADVYTKSAVDSALAGKQNVLTFDNTPTAESTNPVTSGGVEASLATKQDTIQDLTTIRSGAALGATAKQPATTIAGYGITDAYTKQEVNNLVSTPHQNYVTVADYASLPATGSADTIYRVSNYDGTQVDATKYAEYAWDGTQFMLLSVKSAVGEVFDVSEYNSNATYETLAQALAAVPAAALRGGMSVKFIKTTPARYNVVKTEALTEQPTGNLLSSAPAIIDGTYTADQLTAFSTVAALPISVSNSVSYYVEVSGESTTYTTWVVTLVQSSVDEYVQYRYMEIATTATTFTNVDNWQGAANSVDDDNNVPYSTAIFKKIFNINNSQASVGIILDNYYVQSISGALGNNEGFAITETIEMPAFSTIFFKVGAYLNNISVLSLYDSSENKYTPLVISTSSSLATYLYTNNTNSSILVRICYRKSFGLNNIYITDNVSAGTITQLNRDIGIKSSNNSFDFSLEDNENNAILILNSGHIYTKNFDSREVLQQVNSIEERLPQGQLIKINEQDKTILQTTPLEQIKQYVGLAAIFRNWGFIGDSIMSGWLDLPNGVVSSKSIYPCSWGQLLCALCGARGTNFSQGGQTTGSWLSTFPGNTPNAYDSERGFGVVDFDNDPKSSYAICLGVNDANSDVSIGTTEDIDVNDYTNNNLDTYCGRYGKIISLCFEKKPSTKVFVITVPEIWSSRPENNGYNQAVRNIQNLYKTAGKKVYLIDLYNYLPYNTQLMTWYGRSDSAHMKSQGYMYITYAIATYIDYIVKQYPTEFEWQSVVDYLINDNGNF